MRRVIDLFERLDMTPEQEKKCRKVRWDGSVIKD